MSTLFHSKPLNAALLREAFITTTVMLTILLFMYTAVSKVLDQEKFVFQMQLAPISFMSTWAPILGWVLPIVEGLVVVLLYKKQTRLLGMVSALSLMLCFEGYILWMKIIELQTGAHLPCTCGGIISTMGWTTHLLFNAGFILLLALSIYYTKKETQAKRLDID